MIYFGQSTDIGRRHSEHTGKNMDEPVVRYKKSHPEAMLAMIVLDEYFDIKPAAIDGQIILFTQIIFMP